MRYLEDGTHNILLAVDFSQPCKRSFDAAVRMARVFGATLHVLHVDEEENLFSGHSSREIGVFLREIVERRSFWLDDFVSAAADVGVEAQSHLRSGAPVDVILEAADELHAGLIVLGYQGKRGIGHVLTGSVTKRILRRAERPVLLVSRVAGVAPPERGGTFEHIAYPTDFSSASESGLHLAEMFTRRTGGHLSLVNVLRMPHLIPSMPSQEPVVLPESVATRLRTSLERQMSELVSHLDADHVDSHIAMNASSAEGIRDMARHHGVDLIIIPRHRTHRMNSYLFGHTAENLARIAPVPVLTFAPRA